MSFPKSHSAATQFAQSLHSRGIAGVGVAELNRLSVGKTRLSLFQLCYEVLKDPRIWDSGRPDILHATGADAACGRSAHSLRKNSRQRPPGEKRSGSIPRFLARIRNSPAGPAPSVLPPTNTGLSCYSRSPKVRTAPVPSQRPAAAGKLDPMRTRNNGLRQALGKESSCPRK